MLDVVDDEHLVQDRAKDAGDRVVEVVADRAVVAKADDHAVVGVVAKDAGRADEVVDDERPVQVNTR